MGTQFLKFWLLLSCSFIALAVYSQDRSLIKSGEIIKGSANFPATTSLMIPPDARYAGMAQAAVAVSDDASAMYWNAARLAFLSQQGGLSFQYHPLGSYSGLRFYHLSGFHRFEKWGVWGLSAQMYSSPDADLSFLSGLDDVFTPRAYTVSLSHALVLSPTLSLGFTGKYIQFNTYGWRERPWSISGALDIGLAYERQVYQDRLTLQAGLSMSNLGPKMERIYGYPELAPIPATLRIGYGWIWTITKAHTLTLAQDIQKVMVPRLRVDNTRSVVNGMLYSFVDAPGGLSEEVSELTLSTGLEYSYQNKYFIRTGFFYEDPQQGARKYTSLGVGYKKGKCTWDATYIHAWIPDGWIPQSIRMGFRYSWGEG